MSRQWLPSFWLVRSRLPEPALVRLPPGSDVIIKFGRFALLPEVDQSLGNNRGHPVARAPEPVADTWQAPHVVLKFSRHVVDVGLDGFSTHLHAPPLMIEHRAQALHDVAHLTLGKENPTTAVARGAVRSGHDEEVGTMFDGHTKVCLRLLVQPFAHVDATCPVTWMGQST